ncbi:MAG: aminotransferase class III-fold pyridoxal phosphate-dependent enzyme [Candidatus Roizmanbacteria bacterium]
MAKENLQALFRQSEKTRIEPKIIPPINDLLYEIVSQGTKILQKNSNYLEQASHPSGRWLNNVDLERSHGIYIHTKDGQQYLDYSNHWMTSMLDRFKHPELDDPGYLGGLGVLAHEKFTPTETAADVQVYFIDMMRGFFARGREKENFQVLPVSAGAMAVDDAIYTAKGLVLERLKENSIKHQFTSQRNLSGVVFEGAFHGRYGEGASATQNPAKTAHKDMDNTTPVIAPTVEFNFDGSIDLQETRNNLEASMKRTEELLERDDHAYVIIEYPLQAEGGARVINPDVLRQLSEICKKHGKILIVDCVQMGGRSWSKDLETGAVSPFAQEVIDYADIVTFGKIFHVNGSVINKKNIASKDLDPEYINKHALEYGGTHTSTFADMLSGAMIMSVVMQKELWKNALEKTNDILNALKEFVDRHGLLIKPRGRPEDTAYLSWSFLTTDLRNQFLRLMAEKEYIILLAAGENSVRLAPNPDMIDEERDYLIQAIENQLINMKNQEEDYSNHIDLMPQS